MEIWGTCLLTMYILQIHFQKIEWTRRTPFKVPQNAAAATLPLNQLCKKMEYCLHKLLQNNLAHLNLVNNIADVKCNVFIFILFKSKIGNYVP